jgi:hypothetical protein
MMLEPHREGTITQRFILIEKGVLSRDLRLAHDSTRSSWAKLADDIDLRRLERELFAAGWTFSYAAAIISAIGFGFEKRGEFGS